MRTLITGGKSSQALKLLKAFTGDQVLLADYGELPSFSTPQYQFISLGDKNLDTIAHNLLSACLDHQADQLLPLYDFELEAVAKSALLFEEFNIKVLLPELTHFSKFPLADKSSTDWVVYNNGVLQYASDPHVSITAVEPGLSGAFYIVTGQEGPYLSLYHIS